MSTATAVHTIVANPPSELFDFAKRQVFNAKCHQAVEQRAQEREPLVVPVVVQPVDEHLAPIGDSFDAVTRDVSAKGAGLVHLDPIPHERLALHMIFADTRVSLITRVVWSGSLGPFYGTGVEFISKLSYFPQHENFTGGNGLP